MQSPPDMISINTTAGANFLTGHLFTRTMCFTIAIAAKFFHAADSLTISGDVYLPIGYLS
jgi:hypothetical protein